MAYQYGSIDLGIKNPYRIEGAIRAIQGLIVTGLGVSALLQVRNLTLDGGKADAVVALMLGVGLLVYGLQSIGRGMMQMLRFFVGRGVPTSLADNKAKSEAHMIGTEHVRYTDQTLAQMVQGRKIVTDVEPGDDSLSRLILTLAEAVLYLPVVYHNLALQVARALAQSLEVGVLFGFAWFLGFTGLVPVMTGAVLDWTCVALTLYLIGLWWKAGTINSSLFNRSVEIGWRWMIKTLVWTAAIYGALVWASLNRILLPPVPPSVWLLLGGFVLLGAVTMGLLIMQIRARAKATTPETEVSEYRGNWQESIHPQEMFINFESIVMANRRYKEAPNRVYRGLDAKLREEGSASKGHFEGETIQETQPVCRNNLASSGFQWARIVASAIGHGLIVLAAALLYSALGILTSSGGKLLADSAWTVGQLLLFWLVLQVFGGTITRHAHLFWGELQFDSLLVYFQCRGTYSESKLTTGKSVYDSTQSENVVVRSSLTPWVVATRLATSWFANSGSGALAYPRYVLEMHKADTDLNAILTELKQFMGSRAAVAALDTERDVAAVAQFAEINRQTHMGAPLPRPQEVGISTRQLNQEIAQKPPLDDSPARVEGPAIERSE